MPKKVITYTETQEGKGAIGKASKILSDREKQVDCQVAGGKWVKGECVYPKSVPKVEDKNK